MEHKFPTPQEVGIKITKCVKADLFQEGWEHGLKGGQLTDIKHHFKMSFREGFRASKLYLKDLRRKQGIIEFPITGKFKVGPSDLYKKR